MSLYWHAFTHRIVLDDIVNRVRPHGDHSLLPTVAGYLRALKLPDEFILSSLSLLSVILLEDTQTFDSPVSLHAEVEIETFHLEQSFYYHSRLGVSPRDFLHLSCTFQSLTESPPLLLWRLRRQRQKIQT